MLAADDSGLVSEIWLELAHIFVDLCVSVVCVELHGSVVQILDLKDKAKLQSIN
jgi:hypothetical protein